MRSLGEFFGHVVKGIKTDPSEQKTVVKKVVEVEDRGDVILRRTTIEEIQIKGDQPQQTLRDQPEMREPTPAEEEDVDGAEDSEYDE